MGQLTRLQIVTQGQLQAGRDDLATPLNIYFNAWLRSQYAAWPWPFLVRKQTGLALAAGAASISFGAGATVTPEVQRIIDPIFVYDSTYTTKARSRIRQLTSGDLLEDETINNPAIWRGLPTTFKVRADPTLWGKWTLVPIPIPDRNYLLTFDYLHQPADVAADATVPIYPNDRTMIQAVFSETLKYANGADDPAYQQALDVLGAMTIDDRVKYGVVPGTNDVVQLDQSIFR